MHPIPIRGVGTVGSKPITGQTNSYLVQNEQNRSQRNHVLSLSLFAGPGNCPNSRHDKNDRFARKCPGNCLNLNFIQWWTQFRRSCLMYDLQLAIVKYTCFLFNRANRITCPSKLPWYCPDVSI